MTQWVKFLHNWPNIPKPTSTSSFARRNNTEKAYRDEPDWENRLGEQVICNCCDVRNFKLLILYRFTRRSIFTRQSGLSGYTFICTTFSIASESNDVWFDECKKLLPWACRNTQRDSNTRSYKLFYRKQITCK